MLSLTRIFQCLAVSLSVACACAAQTPGKPKSGARKAQPRHARKPKKEMVIIAESVSEPAEVRQVGQAQVSYYHVPGDKVMALVALPGVYRWRGQTIDFELIAIVYGKESSRPDVVHLNFDNHSLDDPNLPFKADRLVLEADGRQFSFNITSGGAGSGLVPHAEIDFPSFERIANSKSVKGRMGQHTFELTESHREALRDLLRVFEVPAKNP